MLRVTPLILLISIATAGCASNTAATDPSPPASAASSAPASTSSTPEPDPYPSASRLARRYLAAALRTPAAARHMTSPDSARARKRLRGMEQWLHQLAPTRLDLNTSHYYSDDTSDRTGVSVQVRVRFGSHPYSHVLEAGSFVVDTSAGSVVSGRMLDPNDQLDAMRHPYTDRGRYGTVIYGQRDLADEAAQLLSVTEAEGPRLRPQFGGGRGIAQPVVVLVKSQAQLTKTCSCSPGTRTQIWVRGRTESRGIFAVTRVWSGEVEPSVDVRRLRLPSSKQRVVFPPPSRRRLNLHSADARPSPRGSNSKLIRKPSEQRG
jgi:hypothetical protein